MGVSFDEVKGRRFARATLAVTPAWMVPEISRSLQAVAVNRPACYARGIHYVLNEVLRK